MSKGKQNLLSFGAIAVISAALFSGHFGVGDVIFPPILGKGAGSSWFMAAMGYGIINSLGVLVAYLAVSRQQKTLLGMSSKTLGRAFGVVFTTICMLIIGPVFILPRVSSATHEMAVALFFPNFPLFATLAISLRSTTGWHTTGPRSSIGLARSYPRLLLFSWPY